MVFSRKYPRYEDWLADPNHKKDTPNNGRIIRLHNLYPWASLSQLRGHPKKTEEQLQKSKPTPVGQRPYNSLNPREKLERERILGVLKDVRQGMSLTKASKEQGITMDRILAQQIFVKIRNRWRAPQEDNLQRAMKINEGGYEVVVIVNGFRIASLIGSYHNAVRMYIEDRDVSGLTAFRYVIFKDAYGKYHRFETNPKALDQIEDAREEGEFFDIYAN